MSSKMWLVRHLEVTRQIVIDDLRVVKVVYRLFLFNVLVCLDCSYLLLLCQDRSNFLFLFLFDIC